MAELSITPRLQLIVIVQKMIILQFSPDHKNGHGNTFTFAFQKECEFPVQCTTAQCERAGRIFPLSCRFSSRVHIILEIGPDWARKRLHLCRKLLKQSRLSETVSRPKRLRWGGVVLSFDYMSSSVDLPSIYRCPAPLTRTFSQNCQSASVFQ